MDAPTGTVVGTITDKTTSEPVLGAWVSVRHGYHVVASQETKADGRYSLTAPVGTWTVGVENCCAGAATWIYVSRMVDPVSVVEGETTTLDVVLTRGGRMEGVVVDLAGRPIAAAVDVQDSDGRDLTGMGTLGNKTSAADGVFSMYELSASPIAARVCAWPILDYQIQNPADGQCGEYITMVPEKVVTGLRIVVNTTPLAPPTGWYTGPACSTECGGGDLPPTGSSSAWTIGAAGVALLLLGVAATTVVRLTARRRH